MLYYKKVIECIELLSLYDFIEFLILDFEGHSKATIMCVELFILRAVHELWTLCFLGVFIAIVLQPPTSSLYTEILAGF